MDEKKRYYWIKLDTGFFGDNTPMDYLLSLPNGSEYVCLYIKLCISTANNNGLLCNHIGEIMIPYDIEKIQRDMKYFSIDTIRVALELYKKLGLIYQEDGDCIYRISNYENMVGSETISAKRKREYRKSIEKKEDVPEIETICETINETSNETIGGTSDVTSDVTIHETSMGQCPIEKEIRERDRDNIYISSDEDIVENAKNVSTNSSLDYQSIMADFHNTCRDLPKIRALSDARKKKIRTLLNEFKKLKLWPEETDLQKLHHVFVAANESDFLCGRNGRWNYCSFDWLINKTNALKVIEGQYVNKGGGHNARNNEGDCPTDEGGRTTQNALERFRRNQAAGI